MRLQDATRSEGRGRKPDVIDEGSDNDSSAEDSQEASGKGKVETPPERDDGNVLDEDIEPKKPTDSRHRPRRPPTTHRQFTLPSKNDLAKMDPLRILKSQRFRTRAPQPLLPPPAVSRTNQEMAPLRSHPHPRRDPNNSLLHPPSPHPLLPRHLRTRQVVGPHPASDSFRLPRSHPTAALTPRHRTTRPPPNPEPLLRPDAQITASRPHQSTCVSRPLIQLRVRWRRTANQIGRRD